MMSMNHDVSFVQLATDVDNVDTVDPCATDARLLSQLLATHIVNRHILTSHFGPVVQKMTLKLILGHILHN